MKLIQAVAGVLVAAGLLFCAEASAQEKSGRFSDNTFISVTGGFNYSVPKIAKTNTWGGMGIAADVQYGKWWNPVIGTSIGWHGVTGRANVDLGKPAGTSYGLNYINAKVLWSITNTFSVNKDRVYNLALYGHLGLLMQGGDGNFFGWGGGLLNTFSVSDHWDILLDLQALIYHRKAHDPYDAVTCCLLSYPSVSVGFAYKF